MKKIILAMIAMLFLTSCGEPSEYDYSNVSSSSDGQQTIQPVVIEKAEKTGNLSPEEIDIEIPSES